jgi:predicted CDP-diglyceride synthetase/phosphatidate cytidylyltransferase
MRLKDRTTLGGAVAAACLTGGFCALFAAVMYHLAPQVALLNVMLLGGLSGFLGSVFASAVMKRRGR